MRDGSQFGTVYHFDNTMTSPKRYGFIRLYQIGELQCNAQFEIHEHTQSCSEISYIVSGTGIFCCNGEEYPVEGGDLFLNQVGDTHSIRSAPQENLRFLYLGFQLDDRLDGDYQTLSRFFADPGPVRLHKDAHDIMPPLLRLVSEFYTGGPCSQLAIESILIEVLILAYRNFQGTPSRIFLPPQAAETAGNTVYSAIRYIESYAADIGEVREVANALGYSSSYLSHLFRQRTGQTLQNYLTRKKVEIGIEMMKSGRYNVTQIAMRLGYDTLQSFSKAFRRIMNVPPTEYLRRLRDEKKTDPDGGGEPAE